MRITVTTFISVAAIAAVVVAQTASPAPDALLQRGIASYRAAQYADAAKDLRAAADALLSDEQMQKYVNTGKFPNLDKVETALVYLTLAETKLGHKEQAREAVLRLTTAERIESVYSKLQLDADAAEFPRIAAQLVPGTNLTPNTQVAAATTTAPPAPATTPAPVPAPAPAPPPVTPSPPVQTAQTTATTPPAPAPSSRESEAAERQRAIDAAVAAERARMQKEADERVAAAQRAAQTRVVATQPALQTDALVRLRQADAYADNGQLARANELYASIGGAPDAPRDVVAEAGVGLYRTGAYAAALTVFRRIAPFARGEEDLRYYNAVSLYETGEIAAAKRELACALPFIQSNEDVERYRAKIERTAALR